MTYSIEPRDKIYLKSYGFLLFAENIGKNAAKVVKKISNNYSQKLLHSAEKSIIDAIKTASKKQFKKLQKQLMI